jgi:hypothetical protein
MPVVRAVGQGQERGVARVWGVVVLDELSDLDLLAPAIAAEPAPGVQCFVLDVQDFRAHEGRREQ